MSPRTCALCCRPSLTEAIFRVNPNNKIRISLPYTERFGLVYTDYNTLERHPKASAR